MPPPDLCSRFSSFIQPVPTKNAKRQYLRTLRRHDSSGTLLQCWRRTGGCRPRRDGPGGRKRRCVPLFLMKSSSTLGFAFAPFDRRECYMASARERYSLYGDLVFECANSSFTFLPSFVVVLSFSVALCDSRLLRTECRSGLRCQNCLCEGLLECCWRLPLARAIDGDGANVDNTNNGNFLRSLNSFTALMSPAKLKPCWRNAIIYIASTRKYDYWCSVAIALNLIELLFD